MVIFGGEGGRLHVYNIETGRLQVLGAPQKRRANKILCVAVCPPLSDLGPLLVASGGTDRCVSLWGLWKENLKSEHLCVLSGPEGSVNSVAFGVRSAGRAVLCSAGKSDVSVWDVGSWTLKHRHRNPRGCAAVCVAVGQPCKDDGLLLASGGTDGKSLVTIRDAHRSSSRSEWVNGISFGQLSSRRGVLFSAGGDGHCVRVGRIHLGTLMCVSWTQ